MYCTRDRYTVDMHVVGPSVAVIEYCGTVYVLLVYIFYRHYNSGTPRLTATTTKAPLLTDFRSIRAYGRGVT